MNIEHTFKHCGYKCEVLATEMGHRCGYVTVPKTHPAYGEDYDDLDIECHGGLTYANKGKFGFDCAHLGDGKDITLMNEATIKTYTSSPFWKEYAFGRPAKSLAFCIEECKSIATQFKAMESNK